jgi:hypothetical protein
MTDWNVALDEKMSFIEDESARALILLRLEGQYIPALRNARNPQQAWRAWEAFRYYLTTRATSRKTFCLTPDEADRVIVALAEVLDLPPHPPLSSE